jgi:hypothetical protein
MSNNSRRKDLIHHSAEGVFSLRVGNWKYIHETTGSGGWPPPEGGGPQPGSQGQMRSIRGNDISMIFQELMTSLWRLKTLIFQLMS